MDIRLIVSIIFLLNMVVIYGFTVDVTPQNNSIVNSLTPTISAQITSPSNTSTFIDWGDSLVGYWNFDSGNSTHAYDLSGNENHAVLPTIGNHISYSNQNSVRGTYVNSSGEFRHIEIEHRDYYNLYQKNTTYSFWVRPKYMGQSAYILQKFLTQSEPGFRIGLSSSFENINTVITMGGGAGISSGTSGGAINNSWVQVTLTINSEGNLSTYLNGFLNKTFSNIYEGYTPSYNSENIRILDREYASFDELMIFNRTLSANEVGAIYNSQVNDFTFMPQDIANLNQYNYTLYTINESGFLDISNYSFFVNYTGVNTNSLFPSQAVSSYLVSILLLFMFFRNNCYTNKIFKTFNNCISNFRRNNISKNRV